MTRHLAITLLIAALGATAVHAKNDAGGNDATPELKPLIQWTFDDSTEPGPRAPSHPSFKSNNTAALSEGSGHVALLNGKTDPLAADLKFGLNDEITLEAWVRTKSISDGSYVYVLGKGRTASSKKNQNYGLRVVGAKGQVKLNFLFASAPAKDQPSGWHRWTSNEAFPADSWHHIAVTYKFGDPKSIKGYIDGEAITGTWDMDGATTRAPVQDDDHLILGTGNGDGSKERPGNRFIGWMDNVAIWKTILPADTLATRYQYIPPPPPIDPETLPAGKVLVQVCEDGIPAKNAWPAVPPQPSETYTEKAFGIFEIPQKYIATGVRGDRPNPFLVRTAAKVTLPAGTHRLLLRGRNASHLHIDGKLVLELAFGKADTGGHGRVDEQTEYLDLGPDFRFAPPGTQEAWIEFTSPGAEHVFVTEQMIGGIAGSSRRRPETGEMVVAISPQGSESWELVTPSTDRLPYNDAGWKDYETERRAWLTAFNAERRAKVRATHDAYWSKRRAAASDWLANAQPVSVPAPTKDLPAVNPIDHFLNAKIAAVSAQYSAAKKDGVNFYKDVMPILETNCFSCHQGGKAKGDLQLDSLQSALHGGESDGPAITPGQPEKSSLLARVTTQDDDYIMPPKGDPLSPEQITILQQWISEGAVWPELNVTRMEVTPLSDDLAFLRRVTLDTVGVAPSLEEIDAFQKDAHPNKRARVIDRLLADARWADRWMGYWQDVLAENPNILNPTLNNTGPFRWYLHEALSDDRPMDVFVTELLRMEGSERFGGPAGFGVASGNDVPMAAKGTIVSTAFLGVEMKCARCHDAPAHKSMQQDLFELAALLATKTVDVPLTSSVPMDKLHEGGRKPLIQVTLQPGSKVEPKWPFADFADEALADTLAENPKDTRDRLASLITAPQNERFAQVTANRVWQQFMGRGIVEPVEDWERGKPTHPELLAWLGREFVRGGYSLKNLSRLILNSHAYQRATDQALTAPSPLFASPAPRRLGAEQILDSLFAATGKPLHTEEVSLDIDGRRDLKNSISLGHPTRAWMLASTSNERDRPSLSLPRIQAVCDVLEAFGWRGARQDPISARATDPNALQPAILGNGTVGIWLTGLSDDHGITELALQDLPLEAFIDRLFLRLLTRLPTPEEKALYTEQLKAGYESRQVTPPEVKPGPRYPVKYVSWSNHLDAEANALRMVEETTARRGDPPTARLDPDWRTRMEDTLWALLNAPEWVFAP